MSFSRRRLIRGVTLIIGLITLALMLHLALEWRQALADIDAMIVTPVTLPVSDTRAAQDGTTSAQEAGDNSAADMSAAADTALSPIGAAAALRATITPVVTPEPPLSDSPLNILLLGTDARPGDELTRTDAMVLIHLDRKNDRVSMLSLPRDLWVTYPGEDRGRINAAYAVGEEEYGPGGGAALAKATVEELLDLEVDYFAMVNFEGFRSLIDDLGGITIDVPEAIYDPAYPTDDYGTMKVRFRAGTQRMSGRRALIYARTRHADSDFGRNQRQQLVLMAIFETVRDRGLLQQLTNLNDYTGALRDYVRTDMPRSTMLDLARWGRDLDMNDVRRYAIDADIVYNLEDPATFAARPQALRRVVGQFTGSITTSAGGLSTRNSDRQIDD
jgi:polyisoprenyl-teichoic acid--peptidoglycan teichoic acid transferase